MADAEPFIDAHVHFWDHSISGLRWHWLEPTWVHPRLGRLPELDRPRYSVAEFRDETDGLGVIGIVHIQAVAPDCDPVEETAWLTRVAASSGWPLAIVGACRLAADDAAQILDHHAEYPLYRGIRDYGAGAEIDTPAFERGVAALAERSGSLEIMVAWPQFPSVLRIARNHPELVVVLGHAGLPQERTDEYFSHWSAGLRELATAPNIICKISTLGGSGDPSYTADTIRRWLLACVDAFGVERCMLASNWPIDSLFGTYDHLLAAYRTIADDLPAADRTALFSGTARRIYRI
jgi:predicted TIM-barrel fold metal-dependent hydrolase